MNKSESIAQLATALALAQGKFPTVKKDANNPFFKSKYADLAALIEAVQEPLSNNGLSIVQLLSTDVEAKFVRVETVLAHKSGEFISDVFSLPVPDWKPQGLGSATTYARRYALQSFLNLGAADDDGNAAQGSQDFTPRAKQGDPKPRTTPTPTPKPAARPEPPQAQEAVSQWEHEAQVAQFETEGKGATYDGEDLTPKARVLPPERKFKGDPKEKLSTKTKRQSLWIDARKTGASDEMVRAAMLEVAGVEKTEDIFVHQTGEIIERLREMVQAQKGSPSPFDEPTIP